MPAPSRPDASPPPERPSGGSRIRPFAEDDAAAVARLHARAYPGAWRSEAECADYFRRVIFGNPWLDPALPSWVAEDDAGVIGFLGVLPRRMREANRPLRAAVCCQFIVDAERRAGLLAFQLLKRFFDGPQDISIADGANDATRACWEAAGGAASPLHGLQWTRLLRPTRGGMELIAGRLGRGAPLLRPLTTLIDDALPAPAAPGTSLREEPVDAAALAACLAANPGAARIRAVEDQRSLEWLLAEARAKRRYGELTGAILRDARSRPAGWFLYYLNGGISQVLQVGGGRDRLPAVLEHLFAHARSRGSAAVQGRLEPHIERALNASRVLLHGRGPHTLLHSRDPSVLLPFYRGDALFSRLDGEWWLRFAGDAPAT